MSELKHTFEQIYEHWGFGGSESRSGPGSSLEETETIRNAIKKLVKEKDIRTVVDIPCGDFNWMKDIVYSFEKYTGGDIVKQAIIDNKKYANDIISFIDFDLAGTEEIPEADLLIVRDVIGHLPLRYGMEALENILRSKCKYLLSTSWVNVNNKEYYKTHKNRDVHTGRFYPVCLQAAPFNLPEPELYIEESVIVDGYEDGNRKALVLWDLQKINKKLKPINDKALDVTIVTGLWNMGREKLDDSFSRSYKDYKERFIKLLQAPVNMFIYVSKEDEPLVWKYRSRKNTYVKVMELSEFDEWFEFYDKVQEIRTTESWYTQTDWLKRSPQANLKYYNPVVFSKMFLLNNASLYNPFSSTNFFWIDAGIANTVHDGYFYHDKVFDNLPELMNSINKFVFLSYPYSDGEEIHGFNRKKLESISATPHVKYVCRGGFFGGPKDQINNINALYYSVLKDTLSQNLMGTEESVFTILAHRFPETIYRYEIGNDGLIWPFFEDLKNVEQFLKKIPKQNFKIKISDIKTNVYVLTFNSPKQFETLCEHMIRADNDMFTHTNKILINNSTDETLFAEYDSLCEKYNFTEIHKDNIGICGGRQYIAEHFEKSDSDFYLFFEDDMNLNCDEFSGHVCDRGMVKYIPNLYEKIIRIMLREQYDFLKLSFSEFYGSNDIQWAWYNVPQNIRTEVWPEYNILPENGLDPNAPKTKFKHIGHMDGLAYITGEIYYSNWPQIVNRSGNRKMFLDTKWEYPYEQTWMSFMFQKTISGELNPAILLASPITHERFEYYTSSERREN
jgi:hypothetical protein